MHGKTVIVLICKNKNADMLIRNYKAVTLVTTISKLFEHCILSCISPFAATTNNQVGFKPQHGT